MAAALRGQNRPQDLDASLAERYRTLADSRDGVVAHSVDGVVTWISPSVRCDA